jgi:hypothetical protein
MEDILSALIDAEACTALLLHHVDQLMEELLKTANDKLDSLFIDRLRHAITYNHYFVRSETPNCPDMALYEGGFKFEEFEAAEAVL